MFHLFLFKYIFHLMLATLHNLARGLRLNYVETLAQKLDLLF